MNKLLTTAASERKGFLHFLAQKQGVILNLLELNGYSAHEDALDDNNEIIKVYGNFPLFDGNLFYSETAHASGVFEFRYFVEDVCPDTRLRDLPDSHFWHAADCITQTITALKDKLYEAEARRASIVCRLNVLLYDGSPVENEDDDEPAETAKKAVCNAAAF